MIGQGLGLLAAACWAGYFGIGMSINPVLAALTGLVILCQPLSRAE